MRSRPIVPLDRNALRQLDRPKCAGCLSRPATARERLRAVSHGLCSAVAVPGRRRSAVWRDRHSGKRRRETTARQERRRGATADPGPRPPGHPADQPIRRPPHVHRRPGCPPRITPRARRAPASGAPLKSRHVRHRVDRTLCPPRGGQPTARRGRQRTAQPSAVLEGHAADVRCPGRAHPPRVRSQQRSIPRSAPYRRFLRPRQAIEGSS